MSHAIHADYTFNQDAFITAQNYHVRFSGRRMRWMRWAYLGITVATVTAVLVTQDNIHPMLYLVLAMGYIGVVFAEIMQHPKMIARAIHKRFEDGTYRAQKVALVMKENSIISTTDGKHETTMSWGDIQKIVETPDGFLMYLNKRAFLWLPFDSLRPDDADTTLRTIWREQQLEYARI